MKGTYAVDVGCSEIIAVEGFYRTTLFINQARSFNELFSYVCVGTPV